MKIKYEVKVLEISVSINDDKAISNLFIKFEIKNTANDDHDVLMVGYNESSPEVPFYPISRFLKEDLNTKIKLKTVPDCVLSSWKLRKQLADAIDEASPDVSNQIRSAARDHLSSNRNKPNNG